MDTLNTFTFHEMFPDDESAVKWFENTRWPDGVRCAKCDSDNVAVVKSANPMPYRCRDCRDHFSYRSGTVMWHSRIPARKWLYAMYLMSVSKKGLSSLQLSRELGIGKEAAWRLGHKIREAWNQGALFPMTGSVEVDETYIGGKERNKHASKRQHAGRGPVGKQAVLGMRERESGKVRAFPIDQTDTETLQGHIENNVEAGATLYTDAHPGYRGMRQYRHEAVAHSAGEYVRGMAHTNGIESFWAILKRGIMGSYHHISVKHLSRYVDEFSNRYGAGYESTLDFMTDAAVNMEGRLLTHRMLVDGEG